MTNSEASADAEISAQDGAKKEEKKPAKVITHTIKGVIEDIEEKQTSIGTKYQALYIGGKVISNFDVDLSDFGPGDLVEITYKQKGVYANLVKIRLLENEENPNPTLFNGDKIQTVTNTKLSASIEFAENLPQRISFKDGALHTLKLLGDEDARITDVDGGIKKGIRYFVEEDGKKKEFFTTSIQLITTLAKFNVGDVVQIQLKHKNVSGRIRTVYEISKISQ